MVKGAQKQMIVVKTGDSRYFDEAYFVLRREIRRAHGARRDMLNEANRILEECAGSTAEAPRKRRGLPWLCFAAGLLCGVLPTLAIFLLLL